MEEVGLVVTAKYDFECRDKSVTPFNFWNYRDFNAKNILNDFSIKSFSPGVDSLMREIKQVYAEKNECEYRDISLLIALFGLEDFDGRIKINNSLIECHYKSVKFSDEASMAEIKPVDMAKHEFEYRDEASLVGCNDQNQ